MLATTIAELLTVNDIDVHRKEREMQRINSSVSNRYTSFVFPVFLPEQSFIL